MVLSKLAECVSELAVLQDLRIDSLLAQASQNQGRKMEKGSPSAFAKNNNVTSSVSQGYIFNFL